VKVAFASLEDGGASSKSAALPHSEMTQSGASRSVAPEMACRAFRWWFARNRGSERGYLSMKR